MTTDLNIYNNDVSAELQTEPINITLNHNIVSISISNNQIIANIVNPPIEINIATNQINANINTSQINLNILSGASSFSSLADTPGSFSGHSGKSVVVKNTEDGLEFSELELIENHSELTLDDGTNPHNTTKSDIGLSNVTDDAQLKVASNLSDVNNQQTSLNNVTAVSGATDEHVLTKDTSTGNAIWKIAAAGGGAGLNEDTEANILASTPLETGFHYATDTHHTFLYDINNATW